MREPILRLPTLLQFDVLIQHLPDGFVPRDPPPSRNYSQGIESTLWKSNIGLLITRHAPSISDSNIRVALQAARRSLADPMRGPGSAQEVPALTATVLKTAHPLR